MSWRAVVGLFALCIASGAVGAFMSAELILGDLTAPKLRIWNFEDRSGTPALYVSKTVTEDDKNSVTLYQLVPADQDGPASPLGVSTRLEGGGDAVAAYLYAENDGHGVAFGANTIAASYNGAPAVGLEVNGVNRSGNPDALVRGIDIVNVGDAASQWALGIETSLAEPLGQPRIGIALVGESTGNPTAPARDTGILIDAIASGQAIRIAAGDHITLDGADSRVAMRFNPARQQIEFLRDGVVRHAIEL